MIIVEWADRGGTGFRPQTVGEQAPPACWAMARTLLDDQVRQPSRTIGPTSPHPVWSLRHVRLGDLGGHWCFAVQGRGGPFGATGMCRFGFLPDARHPAEAWMSGVLRLTSDDVVQPDEDTTAEADLVRVLRGVALGMRVVWAGASPARAATVIERLLRTLPPAVARQRVWTTCPLGVLPRGTQGIVAGLPPRAFRRSLAVNQAAVAIEGALPPPEPKQQTILGAQRYGALIHLARTLTTGVGVEEYRNASVSTAGALLDLVAADLERLSWREVASWIGSRDPVSCDRVLNHPALVLDWAGSARDSLLAVLRERGSPLAVRLPALFPTVPDLGGVERAALIFQVFGPRQRCDPELDSLWLHQLGATEQTCPRIYPRAFRLARQIEREGFAATAGHELGLDEARTLLAEAGTSLEPGWLSAPETVTFLKTRFPDEAEASDLRGWVGLLVAVAPQAHGRARAAWLAEVLATLHRTPGWERRVRAAMYGGLVALVEAGEPYQPHQQLFDVCATIGLDRRAPRVLRTWRDPKCAGSDDAAGLPLLVEGSGGADPSADATAGVKGPSPARAAGARPAGRLLRRPERPARATTTAGRAVATDRRASLDGRTLRIPAAVTLGTVIVVLAAAVWLWLR